MTRTTGREGQRSSINLFRDSRAEEDMDNADNTEDVKDVDHNSNGNGHGGNKDKQR